MSIIKFTVDDAEILYSIPRPGSDIEYILFSYSHTNRCATPSYRTFTDCIQKALNAGWLDTDSDVIKLKSKWHDFVHSADETAENVIESMLDFQEKLTSLEWEKQNDLNYTLDPAVYQDASAKADS